MAVPGLSLAAFSQQDSLRRWNLLRATNLGIPPPSPHAHLPPLPFLSVGTLTLVAHKSKAGVHEPQFLGKPPSTPSLGQNCTHAWCRLQRAFAVETKKPETRNQETRNQKGYSHCHVSVPSAPCPVTLLPLAGITATHTHTHKKGVSIKTKTIKINHFTSCNHSSVDCRGVPANFSLPNLQDNFFYPFQIQRPHLIADYSHTDLWIHHVMQVHPLRHGSDVKVLP